MDVGDENWYWRPTVLVLVCFLHCALIIVLLRAKTTYKTVRSSESLAAIFFIILEPRRAPLPPFAIRSTLRKPETERMRPSSAESLSIPTDPPSSPDNPTLLARPSVDWFGRDVPDADVSWKLDCELALSAKTGALV